MAKKAFEHFTDNAVRAIAMRNAELAPSEIQEIIA